MGFTTGIRYCHVLSRSVSFLWLKTDACPGITSFSFLSLSLALLSSNTSKNSTSVASRTTNNHIQTFLIIIAQLCHILDGTRGIPFSVIYFTQVSAGVSAYFLATIPFRIQRQSTGAYKIKLFRSLYI